MKNLDDPTRWLIDEEAAIVVKYIFKMAMEGRGPSQIATQLTQSEKRIAELDRLFVKFYDDNAKGKLSDERFSMMSCNYEAEQKKLRMDAVELQKNIEEQERQNERLEKFIQKAKHYQDLNSLTPDALRDMVSVIYVGAPDKSSGKRQQKIEIYYDGAGFIPLNLLTQ